MVLAAKLLTFFKQLKPPEKIPAGISMLQPWRDPVAWELCVKFYEKFYDDTDGRTLILGINPGRFGGGVTGIPFTDPIRLEKECGIRNDLVKKAELSSEYIYQMISAYGGVEKFFQRFYISSVSPLGFVKEGKNLNYYDIRELEERITPFIVKSLKEQIRLGLRDDVCFCLGEGENHHFINELNYQHHFFERIIPLAHPRFIMQYRRKKLSEYISGYLEQFESVSR